MLSTSFKALKVFNVKYPLDPPPVPPVMRYILLPGKDRSPQSPDPDCPEHTGRPGPSDRRCSPRCPEVWNSPRGSVRSATPVSRSS